MKARITHLKAPWPSGALVGAVVAFAAGAIPAWAAGKCVPVGDEEEAEYLVEAAPPEVERPASSGDPLADLRAQAQAHFERMKAEHTAELAELQAKLDAKTAEQEALRAGKADAEALAASLQAKLDAAETEDGKAGAALKEADQQAANERAAADAKAKGKK